MSWPTPQDYNEAVQNPHQNFADAELRAGQLTLTPLGLPQVASGAFASVYQMRCHDRKFAIRCFLKNIPDQQTRYARISKYVMSDSLPYTVDFHFVQQGILIKGAWFPVLKMDWVHGATLDSYVKNHLLHPEKIASIAQKFKQMVKDLREAGIAHGDLQHGNIMVTPEEELRLVDYDGMFVPELKGLNSTELGHRNYQHPGRDATHFDARMDNFSAWSIYSSLEIIGRKPSLTSRLNGCDECLLFRQQDYRYPLMSMAFSEVEHCGDEEIKSIAQTLRSLLSLDIEKIPFLDEPYTRPANLPVLQPVAQTEAIAARVRQAVPYSTMPATATPHAPVAEDLETGHFWPSLSEYITAIASPSRNFIPPQMHNYVLAREQGAIHAQGTDHGAVFTFHDSNNSKVMVKVFLKADGLIQQRYEALHAYLHGGAPDYLKLREHFVDFTFYPDSLRVGAHKYYSILRMERKNLKTLFEVVEESRTDKSRMNSLITRFVAMMATLQSAGIVHGDIEPSNILVAKDKLVLVDYDLTTTPLSRPLASVLPGKRHYRHPSTRQGGPEVTDDFAAWILYYSLKLLALYPTFWNEAGAKPGRLLFHADDLKRPGSSPLFKSLRSHFNDEVRSIAAKVTELCKTPPGEIPPFKPFDAGQVLDSVLTQIGSHLVSGGSGVNSNLPAIPDELGGAPLVVALIPAVMISCIGGAFFGLPAAIALFPLVLVLSYMKLRGRQP